MKAIASNEPDSPDGPVPYLQLLAVRLRAEGWYVRLIRPNGQEPFLRVINPRVISLNDDITARPTKDHLMWFWWSWNERISHVGNLDIAAVRIGRVLSDQT